MTIKSAKNKQHFYEKDEVRVSQNRSISYFMQLSICILPKKFSKTQYLHLSSNFYFQIRLQNNPYTITVI